ncbi:MAG: D-aminoacyl-tRNA deacylase [Christensenellales bacterium]
MNRSIIDAGGENLLVSQFTLYGDARHGKRPSFIRAARPEKAIPLYEKAIAKLGEKVHVETGIFRRGDEGAAYKRRPRNNITGQRKDILTSWK